MNWNRSTVMSCIYCFAFCEHLVKGSMGDFFRNYIYRRQENHSSTRNISGLAPVETMDREMGPSDLDMSTRLLYSNRNVFILSTMQ